MGRITRISGTPVVPRACQGAAVAADMPLSFWGGFDPDTGEIIDRRHALSGVIATGRVLVIPAGRGSCSGSGVLLEAIHNQTAPVAIVTSSVDQIIALGAILGDELYGAYPAVVVVSDRDRKRIATGDYVEIDEHGGVSVAKQASHPSSA